MTLRKELAELKVSLDLLRHDIVRLNSDSAIVSGLVLRIARLESVVAGMLGREHCA